MMESQLSAKQIKECHELIRHHRAMQEQCLALGSPRAAQVYKRAAKAVEHYLLAEKLGDVYSKPRRVKQKPQAPERVPYTVRIHRIEVPEDKAA
jgi:hypothetical protein